MPINVIILLPKKFSLRHKYVCDFIFSERFAINYSTTTSSSQFKKEDNSIKINYSGQLIDTISCLNIPNMGLLDETGIRSVDLQIQKKNNLHWLFYSDSPGFQFNNDLFSAVFYLISRYEEYLPFEADHHGRFTAAISLSKLHGFHRKPLLDIWIKEFARLINQFNKDFIFIPKYNFQPSYDIDMAWAYKNKGLLRGLLQKVRILTSTNRQKKQQFIKVFTKKIKDPYYKFSYFNSLEKKYKSKRANYFFAFGNWGKYDKNNPVKNKNFQQLIKDISKTNPIGIHPSYASNTNKSLLKQEILNLQRVLNKSLLKSRQHYLKMSLPYTYKSLVQNGIKEDHSLGFADDVGFRASTSYSFLWYDLTEEKISDLRLHPFQVMEIALFNYLKINSKEAENICSQIIQQVKEYGGTFSLLWHNSSFNEVEDWSISKQDLYEKIYKMAVLSYTIPNRSN